MKASLVKVGDDWAVILPEEWLNQNNIKEKVNVEFSEESQSILISSPKAPAREGWAAQFQKAIQQEGHQPDGELLEGFSNDFDNTEWTWPDGNK